jgi:hypothetical protein
MALALRCMAHPHQYSVRLADPRRGSEAVFARGAASTENVMSLRGACCAVAVRHKAESYRWI